MRETFLSGLTLAYAGGGLVCCLAYFPTIKDLYFHKRASANTATYFLWTITSAITFLYSLFILPDLFFRTISCLNLISCSIVLFLSIRLRMKQR